MSDWAGIKKAINSDLGKPLDTLINDNSNNFKYPNVSVNAKVTTTYTTITGKGKITLMTDSNAGYLQTLFVEIDGVSHNFNVGTYIIVSGSIQVHPNFMSFSFEQSFKVKVKSANTNEGYPRVSYVVQLAD